MSSARRAGAFRSSRPAPDFGRAARDYSDHRAPFPEELFDRLARLGVGRPGQRVLDVGTGTGSLARSWARRGCAVWALDPSRSLLKEAVREDARLDSTVRYLQATAEATACRDSTFDVVSAGVCWHWFDAPRAARELRRILSPGGVLVILHFEWLLQGGSIAEATERLIARYARRHFPLRYGLPSVLPGLAALAARRRRVPRTGIHPDRLASLEAAEFVQIESFSFDVPVLYSPEGWRGRVRSHAHVGGVLSRRRVDELDRELDRLLRDRFPGQRLEIPHRVFAVLGRRPGPGLARRAAC